MNFFLDPEKKPGTFLVAITILITSVIILAKAEKIVAPWTDAPAFSLINFCLLLIACLALIRYLGWETRIGLYSPGITGSFLLFIIPLIAVTLPSAVVGYFAWNPGEILAFILLAFVIGFTEEVVFRGLIQEVFLSWGVFISVLGSALLFGVMHLFSILLNSGNFVCSLGAMATASGFGVCLAALRLRSKALWPLIGLHAWADFVVFLVAGFNLTDVQCSNCIHCFIPRIITGLLFAGYGLFLLRGYSHEPQTTSASLEQ